AVAPAGDSELAPVFVVRGLPAHVNHGFDRGGAADHLATRIVEAAAVEPLLRLGLEHPVRARVADGEEIADGDVEPDPAVLAAGLEQQDAHRRVGGETVRQQAPGRAGADDDVVILAFERRGLGHGFQSRSAGQAANSAYSSPGLGERSRPSSRAPTVIQGEDALVKPASPQTRLPSLPSRTTLLVFGYGPWRAVSAPFVPERRFRIGPSRQRLPPSRGGRELGAARCPAEWLGVPSALALLWHPCVAP